MKIVLIILLLMQMLAPKALADASLVNVAYLKPAEATSLSSYGKNYYPANAVDESMDTLFVTNSGNDSITIDLQDYYDVRKIKLSTRKDELSDTCSLSNFDILGSASGNFETDKVVLCVFGDERLNYNSSYERSVQQQNSVRYIKVARNGMYGPGGGACGAYWYFSDIAVYAEERLNGKRIYVSKDGDDSNDGTQSAPFKTLERAQSEVRKYNKSMTSDITVIVKKGTYFLQKPFELTDEDSGTNGFKVIYRGEDAVLSGGEKVSGFTRFDGDIYKAVLPFSAGRISGLYVNGEAAVCAHSDGIYKANKLRDLGGGRVGLVTQSAVSLSKPSQAQLQYEWSWQSRTYPILDVIKSSQNESVVVLPDTANDMSVPNVMYTYRIWNDYSLLKNPGDFYCDSSENTVYYKKPATLDLSAAEVIVPRLEKVFSVQGKNAAAKASNITVEGFTFAHTEDFAAHDGGYDNIQSTVVRYYNPADLYPAANLVQTASVWVNNADNVRVSNNKFENSQRVGLGLYEGVTNSVVDGNIFGSLASSAITVGLPSHRYVRDAEYGRTNVSFRKKASTSDSLSLCKAIYACDEYIDTHVPVPAGGSWQVDLEQSYSITGLEIDPWPGQIHRYFEIWASDSEDFSDYTVIASVGYADYINGGVWSYVVPGNIKKRYIRFVNTDNTIFRLADLRVYTSDLNGVPATEVCSGNTISNNVISDVTQYMHSAAAIQCFYVADTAVCSNEIYGCSYSGIAMGWGWTRSLDKTMKNNSVENNFIVGAMQRSFDGGSIYSLGIQKNERICGNYVKDQLSGAGIYPDNGSNDIVIENNVAENVQTALFPYGSDQTSIRCKDNYASTPHSVLGAADSYIKNTKLFIKGFMPGNVKAIAQNAGLSKDKRYLRAYADVNRETSEYAENYPTAAEQNMHAYGNGPARGIDEAYIKEAQFVVDTAHSAGIITKSNLSLFDSMQAAIDAAPQKAKTGGTNEEITEASYVYTAQFRSQLSSLIKSGAFSSENYDMTVQNFNCSIPETAENGLINVAYGKPAALTTLYSAAYPASNAVDERTDTMFITCSGNDSLTIDLQGYYNIRRLKLSTRADTLSDTCSLSNFNILGSSSADFKDPVLLCIFGDNMLEYNSTYDVNVRENLLETNRVRYIRITRNGHWGPDGYGWGAYWYFSDIGVYARRNEQYSETGEGVFTKSEIAVSDIELKPEGDGAFCGAYVSSRADTEKPVYIIVASYNSENALKGVYVSLPIRVAAGKTAENDAHESGRKYISCKTDTLDCSDNITAFFFDSLSGIKPYAKKTVTVEK